MDAQTLLTSVSHAYRDLVSLQVEAVSTQEVSEEGLYQKLEERVSASYSRPGKIRIEPARRAGMLIVSDGTELRHWMPGAQRYVHGPVGELPGEFRPEWPVASSSGPFLYSRIHERVAAARLLRTDSLQVGGEKRSCEVIEVEYLPPPQPQPARVAPVVYWIDAERRLVLRMETQFAPTAEQRRFNEMKHVLAATRIAADSPLAPELFQFTPPADAVEVRHMGGGGISYAGTTRRSTSGPGVHCHSSSHWDGEAYITESKYNFKGHEVSFRQRWLLSETDKTLTISQHVTGPNKVADEDLVFETG